MSRMKVRIESHLRPLVVRTLSIARRAADMRGVEARHRGAIRPGSFEIGGPIERFVDRSREVRVVVEQHFDSSAVFVDKAAGGR